MMSDMKQNLLSCTCAAALLLALAACTNDDENLNDGSVAAVINAEISDAVATRASGIAWAERDEIGISESRGTLTATTDATAQQNQPAIDFLYATGATASTHNPEVNFRNENTAGENDPAKDHSFHHCMSQITLTFKEGSGVDFSTIQPTSYTLSGLVLKGSFDTATGTAETDASAQTTDLTMELDGALTSSVILFPQSTTSIELSVNYNSQSYTAMLDIPDGALKAGNNYVWTITVRNKDLSVESAEITAWNKVEDSVNADL